MSPASYSLLSLFILSLLLKESLGTIRVDVGFLFFCFLLFFNIFPWSFYILCFGDHVGGSAGVRGGPAGGHKERETRKARGTGKESEKGRNGADWCVYCPPPQVGKSRKIIKRIAGQEQRHRRRLSSGGGSSSNGGGGFFLDSCPLAPPLSSRKTKKESKKKERQCSAHPPPERTHIRVIHLFHAYILTCVLDSSSPSSSALSQCQIQPNAITHAHSRPPFPPAIPLPPSPVSPNLNPPHSNPPIHRQL